MRFLVALGGPDIYLNTNTGDVELFWWGEKGRYQMDYEVIEALNDYAVELLEIRGMNMCD